MTVDTDHPFFTMIGAMLTIYQESLKNQDDLSSDTVLDAAELFAQPADPQLVDKVDALIKANPTLKPIQEYLFDLALIRIIQDGTEEEGDDYLDSKELHDLEDRTIDRGTELLNLLIYLQDCTINGIVPSTDDFINEFLLDDENSAQDEIFIYEEFIRNQELVEASPEVIIEKGNAVTDDEVREIFTPVMLFFANPGENIEETMKIIKDKSNMAALHGALYLLVSSFYEPMSDEEFDGEDE